MKHLRSFFAVLLAAAICAAVVLFSGCGASVQVQQLTIPGERGSIHATLTTPANAENMPAVVICHGFTGNRQPRQAAGQNAGPARHCQHRH